MSDESPTGFGLGDRSQGYEITGTSSIFGMDAAFTGKDTRDRNAVVTLIRLSDDQNQSALFDIARTYERLDRSVLVGPRTVVRFGGGSAVVIGKEQGAPLSGQTLARWLDSAAPLPLPTVATVFLPVIDALADLHRQGSAHGRVTGLQIISDQSGQARLLGPWLADGGEAREQYQRTQAPELVSGDTPNAVSDVYSLCALMYWALVGTPPPSADDRLTSKAQRDDDPLTPLSDLVPDLDAEVARTLETGLRLHPATRPQSMAALADVLRPHVLAKDTSSGQPAPPPIPGEASSSGASPKSPWSNGADAAPPPLPQTKPRPGAVPPIPKANRTSSIGEAPPPLPGQAGAKPRRRLGLGTILSFGIALAIAWFVASGGLSDGDTERPVDVEAPRDSNRPTTQVEVDAEPRKGPQTAEREAPEETSEIGVREQLCNSRFTFETARDAGANALRAYLQQCDGIDSEFVDAARDALGLN